MQKTPFLPAPTETAEEGLLRATLREHAPTNVDVDRGWAEVAERLSALKQSTQSLKGSNILYWRANIQHRTGRSKKMLIIAAVALLSIVLMGAGVAAYVWSGFSTDQGLQQIKDQHLYQDIRQQQTVGQITIAVNWVYVDSSRTYLAYDVQVPASIAKHYNSVVVGSYSLTDQNGEEPTGAYIECEGFPQDGSPMHCFITSSSFNPRYAARQITITWDVLQLYLIQPTGETGKLAGPWHFQFTVPFHQQNLGPVGPFTQPTHMP